MKISSWSLVWIFLLVCLLPNGGQTAAAPSDLTGSDMCLNLLNLSEAHIKVGLRLGRVISKKKVLEPVLIEQDGEEENSRYSFRSCPKTSLNSGPVDKADLELFNSALVARFHAENTGALTTYRETLSLSYEPDEEAIFAFPGTGAILEARRLEGEHIEVTTTNSMQFLPVSTILLVASRDAMRTMDPAVWDESWGGEDEDKKISRRITWWELEGRKEVRPHRAVDSFEELARQVAEPSTAASEPWNKAPLLQKLQGLLVGDAFSLIVVEAAEHIDLAEAMFKQAKNTNVELDVGTLEELWGKADGENKDPNRTRMEEAGSRGRFLSLVRHYDLAAIMPDRIAGKLRRNYLQAYPSVSSSDAGTTEFSNHYVTLKMASEVFQVGNLIFQDQAAGMKKMVTFLICLLDTPYTREERFRVFTEGLAEMGIPFEDLQQMDFNQAFQYLLQGFSLPPGLRVGERNFVRGVSGGDSEALNFLQGLQVYLDTAVLDASADCDVVLIPDPAASTLWEGEELQVVSSIPTATSKISVGSPEFQGLQKEVQVAKTAAREALKDAIYARGAKNTRRKIVNGHERLDRGNALLARATDDKGLHEAIKAFKKAAKIFEEAKKLSIELENDVPSMPVF